VSEREIVSCDVCVCVYAQKNRDRMIDGYIDRYVDI
jgi:hypothetical protein